MLGKIFACSTAEYARYRLLCLRRVALAEANASAFASWREGSCVDQAGGRIFDAHADSCRFSRLKGIVVQNALDRCNDIIFLRDRSLL